MEFFIENNFLCPAPKYAKLRCVGKKSVIAPGVRLAPEVRQHVPHFPVLDAGGQDGGDQSRLLVLPKPLILLVGLISLV